MHQQKVKMQVEIKERSFQISKILIMFPLEHPFLTGIIITPRILLVILMTSTFITVN